MTELKYNYRLRDFGETVWRCVCSDCNREVYAIIKAGNANVVKPGQNVPFYAVQVPPEGRCPACTKHSLTAVENRMETCEQEEVNNGFYKDPTPRC